ncbi:MAG: MaoC family dehydratase N-terminal domain-containing protein [Rhodospirillales bacterium]|nr:MaoC family dehydratase N-terminal domain-containing protein [Rhodospirillales bacterium]
MTVDLEYLRRWIGRTEDAADQVTAAPLACLATTLDRDDPEPRPGDPLPPGGHWLFFLPRTRHSDLDDNGHARKGGFLPPVPLERRMWAGGRIRFVAPLRVGDAIRRHSEIADVKAKEGNSGPLVFVLVKHVISGPAGVAIEEEHDIVYRGAPPKGATTATKPKPAKAPGKLVWKRSITPDIAMLFRYSALIFNAHRIHYDRDYVTKHEGYPGLIVHGPLIATLLMDLVRRQVPDRVLSRFDYRAQSPLFDDGPFTVAGEPAADGATARLWALDGAGSVAMAAEAGFDGR